jgi:uncharacterized membrane protein YedE/YeeE
VSCLVSTSSDRRRSSPVVDDKFHLPTQRQIDLPLVGGAALFGVGWGLAGICPGPAFADLATLEPKVLLFVAAMLAGMIAASAAIACRGRPEVIGVQSE